MLLIISHHSILYSGILDCCRQAPFVSSAFYYLWGMWGKMAINCFLLLTGYFMCEKNFSLKKFFRLFCEIKFWGFILFALMIFFGDDHFTPKRVFHVTFQCIRECNLGFMGSYLLFYLGVPLYNRVLKDLSQSALTRIVVTGFVVFSLIPTFLLCPQIFYIPCWYAYLYFVGAFVRKGDYRLLQNNRVVLPLLIICAVVCVLSVVMVDFISVRYDLRIGRFAVWYIVHDSYKVGAFFVSVFLFCSFRNVSIGCNRFINGFASCTFGVLLLHDIHPSVRTFVWHKCFNLGSVIGDGLPVAGFKMMRAVLCVYLVCVAIEYVRLYIAKRIIWNRITEKKP